MGNQDELIEAMFSTCQNQVDEFEGGFFSFAKGDEIALVLDGHCYILNCTEALWKTTKAKVKEFNKDQKKLLKWWYSIKDDYEISDWSEDFSAIN